MFGYDTANNKVLQNFPVAEYYGYNRISAGARNKWVAD